MWEETFETKYGENASEDINALFEISLDLFHSYSVEVYGTEWRSW